MAFRRSALEGASPELVYQLLHQPVLHNLFELLRTTLADQVDAIVLLQQMVESHNFGAEYVAATRKETRMRCGVVTIVQEIDRLFGREPDPAYYPQDQESADDRTQLQAFL